ncbi:AvrRpt-cleavage domain-containing protein [Hirschfeldia incana]|nr:AvrRpt-cleavage domain-containing protein [Hirschfeldia incana]
MSMQNAGWTPVPQFGGWDQKGLDATDYSVVFKKARANRKLNKSDVTHSLGSEQELMASARRHHHQQLHHRRETQDDDPVMLLFFYGFFVIFTLLDDPFPLSQRAWIITRWYNN